MTLTDATKSNVFMQLVLPEIFPKPQESHTAALNSVKSTFRFLPHDFMQQQQHL